jgi:rhamnulokinase
MAHQFLAFDLGAESGRAVLGALEGGHLTLQECHRFANPHGRMNGLLQWDLLGQWEQLKQGLRRGAELAGNQAIAGIGVDTWGVDFGLLGPNDELLGNPGHYRDARNQAAMAEAMARVGRERIFTATGIQPLVFNTLYQLLAMRKSAPALLAAARTLLLMPDLFNFLFTGEKRAEFSIASTTQMFDMTNRAWARGLLQTLDLPAALLPEVVASGTVVGTLRADVARECGVGAEITVIAPAGHDTASAVAACPAAEGQGSWCYISSGTWSLMGVELQSPIVSDEALAGGYTNEGGVGDGGRGSVRFLRNIMGLWLVQECRRHWITQGHDHGYAELTQMAERARSTALIDPDHPPFLSPGNMIPKIDAFLASTHQRGPTTRGEYVRLCLDSLALTYRRTLEGLEKILGRRIDTIHILGGGSQNALLNQMTADACGRAVVAGPVEATAIGNIIVQAMAVGAIESLAAGRRIVRENFAVTTYEPRRDKDWDAEYGRFLEIVRAQVI